MSSFYLSEEDRERDIIRRWHDRSQLNYIDLYVNLFISYNAWFKKATKKNRDRDAIDTLKSRNIIWDEYLKGNTFYGLRAKVEVIATKTTSAPLLNFTGDNRHWNGIVKDANDWKNLIEFWYRVRCNLFHGTKSPEDGRDQEVVQLAYESLNIFMTEIIRRMDTYPSTGDRQNLKALSRSAELLSDKLSEAAKSDPVSWSVIFEEYEDVCSQAHQLSSAFEDSFELWNVDMEDGYGR